MTNPFKDVAMQRDYDVDIECDQTWYDARAEQLADIHEFNRSEND